MFIMTFSTLNPSHAQVGALQGQTLNATQVQQTVDAIIFPRLTFTAIGLVARTNTALANLTATQNYSNTTTAIAGTNGITQTIIALTNTLTPSPTPTETNTPTPSTSPTPSFTPNGTDQANTIAAIAYSRLTATISAQQTNAAQRTIDAIIAGTLQYTATPSVSPTVTATTTLNAIDIQNTLNAQVALSLSQTPQAAFTQTASAAFKATVEAFISANQTATSVLIRSTLAANVGVITAANASRLISSQTIQLERGVIPRSIAFNGIGDQFVVAEGNSVSIWDVLTGRRIHTWNGLTDRVSVAFSSNGTRVAAASSDATVRLYDVSNNLELPALQGHTGAVQRVIFSPDGKLLASAGEDKTIRLWNAQTGASIRVLGNKDIRLDLTALAFNRAGTLIFAANKEGRIIAWEIGSGAQVYSVRIPRQLTDLAFSPDGKLLAASGASAGISILQADNGSVVQNIAVPFYQVNGLAFLSDNAGLVVGGVTGRISIQNPKTGAILVTLIGHTTAVNDLALSPDGTRLVSVSEDGTIRVWSVTTLQKPPTTPKSSEAIPTNTKKTPVTFTPTAPGVATSPTVTPKS